MWFKVLPEEKKTSQTADDFNNRNNKCHIEKEKNPSDFTTAYPLSSWNISQLSLGKRQDTSRTDRHFTAELTQRDTQIFMHPTFGQFGFGQLSFSMLIIHLFQFNLEINFNCVHGKNFIAQHNHCDSKRLDSWFRWWMKLERALRAEKAEKYKPYTERPQLGSNTAPWFSLEMEKLKSDLSNSHNIQNFCVGIKHRCTIKSSCDIKIT